MVDTKVVTPDMFDFFLASHLGIQVILISNSENLIFFCIDLILREQPNHVIILYFMMKMNSQMIE